MLRFTLRISAPAICYAFDCLYQGGYVFGGVCLQNRFKS